MTNDDNTVKEMKKKFEEVIKEQKGDDYDNPKIIGITILLVITDNSAPQGTTVDEKKMRDAFKQLKFGVWTVTNPTFKELAAVMHLCTNHTYMTEPWCNAIIIYFAGHGGSQDGKAYVITAKDGNQSTKYFIDDGIIYPLQPSLAPHLGSRYRLFFFDCCMSEGSNTGVTPSPYVPLPQNNVTPSFLPPRGLCLVAYATSMSYTATGSFNRGGVWTRKLVENICNYDLPISVLLDLTYEDVARETNQEGKGDDRHVQGSNYSSSLGLFFLRSNHEC